MKVTAVFLKSAKTDLKELRAYIVKNFGQAVWQSTYGKIKESVVLLESFPEGGTIPDELQRHQLQQFRQIVSGMNRIIYEIHGDRAFIHLVCDSRKDFKTLLMRRLLGHAGP